MKKLNLSLIALLFSSLLMGCGMSGPLYRAGPPALEKEPIKSEQTADIKENKEKTESK